MKPSHPGKPNFKPLDSEPLRSPYPHPIKVMSPATSKSKKLELEFKEVKKQHQFEIVALKRENLKWQKQVFKLRAKNIALLNEIKILRTEYSKYVHDNPPPRKLTAEQKEELQLIARLRVGYERTRLRKVETDEDIEKPT